jgi:two-component system response regulator YesN
MNLMIVEDELRLRNSLANNIPWEEHGIEVVGLAGNGQEALAIVERKRPDIMLLDVQMPGMDGLTLVRTLRQKQESRIFMKFIILSGHDNFGFAQNAMAQGVSRYLLKPAGEKEILDAVLEAGEELRRELEEWQKQAALQEKWREHLPLLQNGFFQRWAEGGYSLPELLRRARDYSLDLPSDARLAAAVVDLDPITGDGVGDAGGRDDEPLLAFSLQCMARDMLPEPACYASGDLEGKLLLIFLLPPQEDEREALLRVGASLVRLLSHAKEVLKATFSAGVCGRTGSVEELGPLVQEARRALRERMVYGTDIVIPYREQGRTNKAMESQPNLEKMLEIALETADEDKAMEALAGLWEAGLGRAGSAEEVHETVLYLSSLFIRIIQKQGWSVRQVVEGEMDNFLHVRLLDTREETWSWLTRTVKKIAAFIRKERSTTSNQVVKSILAIVDQEIDRDITLHMVADRMYVNSSYLSRLFKQETGVPFSTYVLERKMEKAKSILQEGGKVYDAARLVGYRDVSYFTKVFRKYWGVTPGEMKS